MILCCGKGGGNGEWEAAASSLHGAHPDFAKFEHKRTLFLWRCKHKPRRCASDQTGVMWDLQTDVSLGVYVYEWRVGLMEEVSGRVKLD